MAQASVKKKRSKHSTRNAPNPKIIRAVQNYILGAGETTQEQAMIDAGYAKTTAKKQCHLITHHALYQEYMLAQAEQVKVSKDFINLKYLMILARPGLKLSDEFKALDCLATINGHKPKEGADAASGVNIWQLLVGGNGDFTSEKELQERLNLLRKNSGGAKTRF